jgi:hypothetical protein
MHFVLSVPTIDNAPRLSSRDEYYRMWNVARGDIFIVYTSTIDWLE